MAIKSACALGYQIFIDNHVLKQVLYLNNYLRCEDDNDITTDYKDSENSRLGFKNINEKRS